MSSQKQEQEGNESSLGSELRQVCRSGEYEIMCAILEKAGKKGGQTSKDTIINEQDDISGNTALHMSCANGHVAIVEVLLTNGVRIDAVNESGSTALHYACLTGQEDVVKLLLQHGADAIVENSFNKTPLDEAARAPHQNIIDLLIHFVEDGINKDTLAAVNKSSTVDEEVTSSST